MISGWFQTCINWKMKIKPVIWRHQIQSSISSMVLSLFHESTWSDLLCLGHCVYFATLIASIHYSKQSVVDSRKFEGYCVYLRKAIVALFYKAAYLFHWTSCSNFCSQPPHYFMVTAQKWSFPLRISSVNVAKSAVVQWVNVLTWQIWFCWFELAAVRSICSENVYSLSSENNQG